MKRIGVTVFLALAATACFGDDAKFDITGDAAKGERVFKKCQACHETGAEAKSKTGPVLNGILGRVAGSTEGFGYSEAIMAKGAEGLIWTPETLAAFLEKPKDFLAGTKMTFAGLRKAEERDNVIAYLAQFN